MTRRLPTWAPTVVALFVTLGCGYHGELVGVMSGNEGGAKGGAGAGTGGTSGSAGSVGTAGAAGAGDGGGTPRSSEFILGADISWVQEEEDQGAVFFDQGVPGDILDILKRHGFNSIRLRLFHDPSVECRTLASGEVTCGYLYESATRTEPYCDLEHTLTMAQRVKAAKMSLLLNFHYSDTWADPDDQNKPLAWEGLDFDQLTVAVEEYTRDTLDAFEAVGALPDMVQLGNEITPGMLFPEGSSSEPGNFERFATLLKAGVAGVRAVSPEIQIILHIEKPDSFATSDWWLRNVLEQGVEFDILAQSCYPQWHGSSEDWAPTFEQLNAAYPDLHFMIVEYSEEKRAVNDILFELPNGRGLGSYIWEPTLWGETLFDRDGDRRVANEYLELYDQMAEDYGLR